MGARLPNEMGGKGRETMFISIVQGITYGIYSLRHISGELGTRVI
jgi:hypothetical protein